MQPNLLETPCQPDSCDFRVRAITHTLEGVRRRKKCIHCKANIYTLEVPFVMVKTKRRNFNKVVPDRMPFETIQQIRAEYKRTGKIGPLLKKFNISSIHTLHDWLYKKTRINK